MTKNKLYFIIIVSYTTVYSMQTPTAGLSWGNWRQQGTLVFPEEGIKPLSTFANNYAVFFNEMPPGDGCQRLILYELLNHLKHVPAGFHPYRRFNHNARVNSVVFSLDGTQIASASDDRTVQVRAAGSGKLLHRFNHNAWVRSVVFSPDGTQIASGSDDGTVQVRAAGSGELLHTLNHNAWVNSVVFSPDGTQIAYASDDGTVLVMAAGSGELLHRFNHGNVVRSIVFSPDGTQIASGSNDGTVLVRAAGSGELLHRFNHGNVVLSIVFSPDGTQIASGSNDGTVRLWLDYKRLLGRYFATRGARCDYSLILFALTVLRQKKDNTPLELTGLAADLSKRLGGTTAEPVVNVEELRTILRSMPPLERHAFIRLCDIRFPERPEAA